jgi:gas vesicle protein
MARNRHNGALVFGALLGGAVGAAAALWKTPYTGAELRGLIGLPNGTDPGGAGAPRSLGDRALELVEQATAPLVGVRLGQTANNSQPARGSNNPTSPVPSDGRISDTEFTEFPAQQQTGTNISSS